MWFDIVRDGKLHAIFGFEKCVREGDEVHILHLGIVGPLGVDVEKHRHIHLQARNGQNIAMLEWYIFMK